MPYTLTPELIENNNLSITENADGDLEITHKTSGETITVGSGGLAAGTVNTDALNSIRVVGPDHFTTLQAAHDDLPAAGGTVILNGTVTESSSWNVTKKLTIIGGGLTWPDDSPAYIDLGGNTLQVAERGQTWRNLQLSNGNLIIGQHDAFGGRNRIEVHVTDFSGTGIEFRGGHLDSVYHVTAQSGDRGVEFNLNGDGVDYFNQNVIKLTAHNMTGDGLVMTGIGTDHAQIRGNDWLGFEIEQISGTGWTVDSNIHLSGNKFVGYGVHDGGVNVQPDPISHGIGNNTVNFAVIRGGGTMNIGGTITAFEENELRSLTTDAETVIRRSGTRILAPDDGWEEFRRLETATYDDYTSSFFSGTISTTAQSLGATTRTADFTIHGEDVTDGTVSFVDKVSAIAFGSANQYHTHERGTPATRTYSMNGNELEMSVSSGDYAVHVERSISGQKG